jgi:hypothetical protein
MLSHARCLLHCVEGAGLRSNATTAPLPWSHRGHGKQEHITNHHHTSQPSSRSGSECASGEELANSFQSFLHINNGQCFPSV